MAGQEQRHLWLRTHFAFQNGKCKYCKFPMVMNPYGWRKHHNDDATLDHVEPLSKGGKDSFANTVAACHSCNNKKGDTYRNEGGNIGAIEPFFVPSFKTNDAGAMHYKEGWSAARQGHYRSICYLRPTSGYKYEQWQQGYNDYIKQKEKEENDNT